MAKRGKTRREVMADFRRTEILSAALKVFGKKGFADTRMEDVAAEAQIAKGTLYLYFPSKSEIYSAAVVHAMDKLSDLAQERLAGVEGLCNRLSASIALRLEFWSTHKELYRMLLTVGREPQNRKQTNAMIQRAASSLTEIMEEGIRTQELRKQDFKMISLAIVDMMRGANERRMDGFSATTPKEDAAAITQIVLASLDLQQKEKTSDSRRVRV